MTKGDSCDANPIHPLAHVHTHTCASSSNQCSSFTELFFFYFFFSRLKSLQLLLFADSDPITVIRS